MIGRARWILWAGGGAVVLLALAALAASLATGSSNTAVLAAFAAILAALVASGVNAAAALITSRADRLERERAYVRDRSAELMRAAEHIVWECSRYVWGGPHPTTDPEDVAALSAVLYATAPTSRIGDASEKVYDAVGAVMAAAEAVRAAGGMQGPDATMSAALGSWHNARKAMIDALREELGREPYR